VSRSFTVALVAAAVVAVGFLALPLAALFVRVGPGELLSALGGRVARDAIVVSFRTNLVAEALIVLLGTPAAYLLARRRFPGRALVLTLIELPLVLPPAVGGIALLAAFGRTGLLGGELHALGLSLPFTQAAVVLAIAFVAAPFYVRPAVAAFESVDETMLDAARTLGARPPRVFARVALPLAAGGLAAATAISFARGLGEFGATIMFAGSLQGRTQTLPLAIYAEFERNFNVALALGALLVAISFAILLSIKLVPSWTRYALTFPFRSAASSSS
jgi:molybdate transport system permease protein